MDLHIHSRFSRATSKSLDPVSITEWAKIKGLDLVGTGDMTHPGWLARLRETLVRSQDGFYRLKDGPKGPGFVPTGEVSAIYKDGGRTRKIHLVVVAPDLEAAERFSRLLGKIGNVTSDGRPILGLSARNIMEIALTADPEMEIIPAHVWTPWFSLFGSKSGYDAVEECFGDLSGHVHALETGLSSDPEMNRLISALDGYALVSSSDAHGPDKLGREATVIEGPLDYAALKRAFLGEANLVGTVEFFPEEGKYHLDGHADCGPALTPAETKAVGGLCPVCGKPLTVGVLSRVMELADREKAPDDRLPDWHLLPLVEVLSQTLDMGPTSQGVIAAYQRLVGEFGSEYGLLLGASLEDIRDTAGPVLARAVERMRLGEVEASGGYDGKFGRVIVLGRSERLELSGQGLLFGAPAPPKRGRRRLGPGEAGAPMGQGQNKAGKAPGHSTVKRRAASGGLLGDLSSEQLQAVTFAGPALAVSAGPGAGKTLVLVRRAVYLVRSGAAAPEKLLLTTYTRKAAETLSRRLAESLGEEDSRKATVRTLHALALSMASRLKEGYALAGDDTLAAISAEAGKLCGLSPRRFQNFVTLRKNTLGWAHGPEPGLAPEAKGHNLDPGQGQGSASLPWEGPDGGLTDPERAALRLWEGPDGGLTDPERAALRLWEGPDGGLTDPERAALRLYRRELESRGLWDYDDLILEAAKSPELPLGGGFDAVLADEFQDFSLAQYAFFMGLAHKASLTVIGDPDQSVYGFRGAHGQIFDRLARDRVDLVKMDLSLNFRSTPAICQASEAARPPGGAKRSPARSSDPRKLARAVLDSPVDEADWVAAKIVDHLGVTDLGPSGSQAADKDRLIDLGLAEVAVIFRLRQVGHEVARALERVGLPYQMAGEEEETATDLLDFKADKVSLLTMHASKGLEFRLVFVIGLEEGLCPYEFDGTYDEAEERRLFYVALTRAKEMLYLTRSSRRFLFGRGLSGQPSPFWSLVPPGLCRDFAPAKGPGARRRAKSKIPQGNRLF